MTEHHLAVTRTARYYQLGELSESTTRVWFVCHGYGQLAAYFIRHFAFLTEADPHTVVVAPEGLSRFYLSGNGGRVGASWMTRDDRLHEIEDHIGFLNQLAGQVLAACSADVQVTVLGFSQGTATVSRWLDQAAFRPAHLVLWAGGFPEDLARAIAAPLLHQLPLTLVVGTDDEYVSAEKIAQQQAQLEALGATPRLLTFAGKHQLDRRVLEELAGLTRP
ncbi:alpha/beta hydrolase [Hymenobacter arizonensis]|uniref:Predicted esterase n=1 Tax=Hymenobacter arizonensis TaxID=1227077 RepID=A0A1I5TCL0_HYMAR|nr:phospholipase [Hymenobacter arizonensis]SFP80770.1 Predicted esterase [Hymenobacter arizonensis]